MSSEISFRITYYSLFFVSCLSFFISFFIKSVEHRNILWLESTITGISSFIYSFYMKEIKNMNNEICQEPDWKKIDFLRYIDWAITTPMMLLSLSMILSMNSGIKIDIVQMCYIFILDWIMLYISYAGENNEIDRTTANILEFIPFVIIFGLLYNKFIRNKNIKQNNMIFVYYFIVWFLYGILYMFDEKTMNTYFNILDVFSKTVVTIVLTIYYLYN